MTDNKEIKEVELIHHDSINLDIDVQFSMGGGSNINISEIKTDNNEEK